MSQEYTILFSCTPSGLVLCQSRAVKCSVRTILVAVPFEFLSVKVAILSLYILLHFYSAVQSSIQVLI